MGFSDNLEAKSEISEEDSRKITKRIIGVEALAGVAGAAIGYYFTDSWKCSAYGFFVGTTLACVGEIIYISFRK